MSEPRERKRRFANCLGPFLRRRNKNTTSCQATSHQKSISHSKNDFGNICRQKTTKSKILPVKISSWLLLHQNVALYWDPGEEVMYIFCLTAVETWVKFFRANYLASVCPDCESSLANYKRITMAQLPAKINTMAKPLWCDRMRCVIKNLTSVPMSIFV
jgi:hypothetical protein